MVEKYNLGETGPLQFELKKSGREVELIREFVVVRPDGRRIHIPAGFITHFASVPRFFWRIIPPWGEYSPAAVTHDWLYVSGDVKSRLEADRIFYRIMLQLGVTWWKRVAMFLAVRAGGWIGWNHYRKVDKIDKS